MRCDWVTLEWRGPPLRVCMGPCTYPPLEDTQLALRLLERVGGRLPAGARVVDVGTGSGVLALAAHRLLRPRVLAATDVSPWALASARETLRGTGAQLLLCDLASCLAGEWDLLVSNPPYLPGGRGEGGCGGLEWLQWGGAERVLPGLCGEAERLARRVLIVYSSLSPVDVEKCLEKRGFRLAGAVEESFFMETIRAVYMERERR